MRIQLGATLTLLGHSDRQPSLDQDIVVPQPPMMEECLPGSAQELSRTSSASRPQGGSHAAVRLRPGCGGNVHGYMAGCGMLEWEAPFAREGGGPTKWLLDGVDNVSDQ